MSDAQLTLFGASAAAQYICVQYESAAVNYHTGKPCRWNNTLDASDADDVRAYAADQGWTVRIEPEDG